MSTRTASILHNAAVDQEGRHLGFFGYQPGQPMVVVFNAEIPTGITAIQALGLLFEKILFPFCPSDPDRRRSMSERKKIVRGHRGVLTPTEGQVSERLRLRTRQRPRRRDHPLRRTGLRVR